MFSTLSFENYEKCWKELEFKIALSYFFNKKSIMNVDGFPTTMGSFSDDAHTALTMQPAPESKELTKLIIQPMWNSIPSSWLRRQLARIKSQFAENVPGTSCDSVKCPVASRLVAIKRHPGFSRRQNVAYLMVKKENSIVEWLCKCHVYETE